MNLAPEAEAFVRQHVPATAMVTGYVVVVAWINPESGEPCWTFEYDSDYSSSHPIGLLELTKHEMLVAEYTRPGGENFA